MRPETTTVVASRCLEELKQKIASKELVGYVLDGECKLSEKGVHRQEMVYSADSKSNEKT